MRQDITGLELTNMGGGVTRILAAVGVRGFATTVQYDLGQNGANGIYNGDDAGERLPDASPRSRATTTASCSAPRSPAARTRPARR